MPPKRKPPKNFDEHLGLVVENAARRFGGREYLAGLLNWSSKTVDRRVRGEAPFLVPELRLIAPALEESPAALVEAALKQYGGTVEKGMELLAAEYAPVSEGAASLDDHRQRKQAEARGMTGEEWDRLNEERSRPIAATGDEELGTDEPGPA